MKNTKYIGLFLLGFLILVGCKKSQWKKPTEVTFMVDINKAEGMNGNLSFSEGQTITTYSIDNFSKKEFEFSITHTSGTEKELERWYLSK